MKIVLKLSIIMAIVCIMSNYLFAEELSKVDNHTNTGGKEVIPVPGTFSTTVPAPYPNYLETKRRIKKTW